MSRAVDSGGGGWLLWPNLADVDVFCYHSCVGTRKAAL